MHPRRTDGRKSVTLKDEIVEQVRAAREAYAARFDFDLDRIFEDLKKHEGRNSAPRADLKPLKPRQPQR
jgi:hypothetical protein